MIDFKQELLSRLQQELDAMRGRAETAKYLALASPTHQPFLIEHAATIQRATFSLEKIIRDIHQTCENSETSIAEPLRPQNTLETINAKSQSPGKMPN